MAFSDEDKILIKSCMIKSVPQSLLKKVWTRVDCRIVSTRDKSIVRTNWNGSSLMSGAVLNSQILTRLLTTN